MAIQPLRKSPRTLCSSAAVAIALLAPATGKAQLPGFTEVALTTGVSTTHGLEFCPWGEADMMSGGTAGADGDFDIFLQNGYGITQQLRNDMVGATRALTVSPGGSAENRHGIGARIWLQFSLKQLGRGDLRIGRERSI
jgi:hypothetical protein